jgi:hypothetical protein
MELHIRAAMMAKRTSPSTKVAKQAASLWENLEMSTGLVISRGVEVSRVVDGCVLSMRAGI